jgi:hypothetical protein
MDRSTFILWNPTDRQRAMQAVMRLTKGWRVEIKAPKRTLDQNSKLWALLTEVAEQAEWAGKVRTPLEWKDLFTGAVKVAGGLEAVPGLEGGLMILGLHTSDMSVSEMVELIDYIEAWGTQNGITFSEAARDGEAPNTASPKAA